MEMYQKIARFLTCTQSNLFLKTSPQWLFCEKRKSFLIYAHKIFALSGCEKMELEFCWNFDFTLILFEISSRRARDSAVGGGADLRVQPE